MKGDPKSKGTQNEKNKERSILTHVNGMFAIGGLVAFYAKEAYGRPLMDALAAQSELAIIGLCALFVLSLVYVGSQVTALVNASIRLIDRVLHGKKRDEE